MAATVDARLQVGKPKAIGMEAKDLSRKLKAAVCPDAEWLAGRVIDAAIHHARLTDQQAAAELGYADPTIISQWRNGTNLPPALVRLISSAVMRSGLVVAMAELPGDDVNVETVVRVGRKRA